MFCANDALDTLNVAGLLADRSMDISGIFEVVKARKWMWPKIKSMKVGVAKESVTVQSIAGQ